MAGKLLDSPFGLLKPATSAPTSHVMRAVMTRIFAAMAAAALLLTGCADNRGASNTVTKPPAITVKGSPNTIPAGTTLEVRTNEPINSTHPEGRTYQADIATEVVDTEGKVLLPKGSQVELVILEAKEKSGIKGAALQLGMRSVTVNGQTYLVVSEEVKETTGLGRNKKTAQNVGGGAALGTLIGAAAGGGKGAVLGGIVGAAAGAAVQVLTQGKEVRIPAESVLRFQLDEPIRLQTR
jgi:outer membrane lipoprotein SlyB